MDVEDIVIGSGLAALGTVLGLEHSPRVLVLGGPAQGSFSYYDARGTVPCAYSGEGGLGNDWHGVIPTGLRNAISPASDDDFRSTFAHFYPHTGLQGRLREPHLFVPWRPIRPRVQLQRLAARRGGRLVLRQDTALGLRWDDRGVEVTSSTGTWRARRAWLAAGALHSPLLLERSVGRPLRRGTVSDHAFVYLGHVDGVAPPRVSYSLDGMVMPCAYSESVDALYTVRPARFAFRTLDLGIEQRALFGLPTGSAVAKIARRLSPGLLAEALFNRFGLFPRAARYSAYAQVLVPDAYEFHPDRPVPLQARAAVLRAATDAARAHGPFPGLQRSMRPEVHIPGIHLHHTLDRRALAAAGIDVHGSPVQVVDASTLSGIGPDHHSFKMLLAARMRARLATATH
jgi:hypothetical protein